MQGLQEYVALTVQAWARVAGICGFDCTRCNFENDMGIVCLCSRLVCNCRLLLDADAERQ